MLTSAPFCYILLGLLSFVSQCHQRMWRACAGHPALRCSRTCRLRRSACAPPPSPCYAATTRPSRLPPAAAADEPDAVPAPAAPSDALQLLRRVESKPSTVENGRQVE